MKFKRLLAVILGAMMIMSCFSFTANAQEATNSVTPIALNSAYGTWVSGCNTTGAIDKCGWKTKHYDYATETFYRRFTAPDKSVSDQTGNNTAYFYQDYSGTASNSTGSFVLKMRIRSSDPVTPHINANNDKVDGSGVYTVKGVNADGTAFVSEVNKWQDVYVPFTLNKGATKVTHCLMYLGGNKSIASYYDENGNVVDYVDLAAYAFFNTMEEAKAYNFVVGEKIEDVKAVYISANGDDANSGRHSTLPVKTLARADAIFEAAGNEALDTLYVIGSTTPYTIVKEGKDTAAEISFGTTAKTIKIRGYNGKSDVFYPTDSHFAFDGALDFDNITIKQGGGDGKFMAQGHDFVAGENVAVEGAKNFSNFYYGKKGNHGYGTSSTNLANATAIFNGGSWGSVHGGFWTGGTYSGNATIIVDGATLTSIKNGHGSGTNQYFKGDFRVDVESGSVGAINLDSSTDNAINSYAGVRYFTLNGGDVTGDITVTSKNVSKDGKLTKSADSGYTIVEINAPNVLKGSIVQGKADDDAERIVIYNNNSYVAGQVKDVKAKVIIPVGGTLTANASSTINSSGTVTTVFDTYSYTADASVNTIKINDVRYPVSHFEAGKIPSGLFVSGENRVEFLTLEEELVHSDRMQAYIDAGYNVVYVSANGADNADGATFATPKKADSFAEALNAAVTENGKTVIALIGEIKANATVPNDVDGADVIITSAIGANGTNGGYLNYYATNSNYDTILPKGESNYTFDNIYIKVGASGQSRIYASGANVKLTSTVKSNTATSGSGLTIAHGRDSADAFTGGTIEVDIPMYLLRSGAGKGNNITGDITYILNSNAVVGILAPGGHAGSVSGTDTGTLKGNAYAYINGATVKQFNPGYMATVNGDVIVHINDGGHIDDLKSDFDGNKGVLNGDYVIYLNNGTIGAVNKFNGGTLKGKKVLVVNDNTSDVPETASALIPYIVSYTGNGTVEFDTATDKLVIAPADGAKYVKVTNGDTVKTYNTNGDGVTLAGEFSVDLASGTTTVEFLTEGTELFTITFVDGDTTETQTVTAGTVPTAPVLTKTGYTLSWDKEIVAVTAPVTYTAVWTAKEYDVVFNAGEGTFADGKTVTVKTAFNSAITAPATPTRTGYAFKGWDAEVGTLTTEGATFNAVWEVNKYDVVFNAGEGTFGESNTATVETTFGEAITAPANPTREGYVFFGWDKTVGNLTTEGATFTAVWEMNHVAAYRAKGYTVVYIKDGVDKNGSSPIAPYTSFARALSKTKELTANDTVVYALLGDVKFGGWLANGPASLIITKGDESGQACIDNIWFNNNSTKGPWADKITFDNIKIGLNPAANAGDEVGIYAASSDIEFTSTVVVNPQYKFTSRTAGVLVHPYSANSDYNFTNRENVNVVINSGLVQGARATGFQGGSSTGDITYVFGGTAEVSSVHAAGHVQKIITAAVANRTVTGDIYVTVKENAKVTNILPTNAGILDGNLYINVEGGTVTNIYLDKGIAPYGDLTGSTVITYTGGTIGKISAKTAGNVVGTKRILIADTSKVTLPATCEHLTGILTYTANGSIALNEDLTKIIIKPEANAKYVKVTMGDDVKTYNVNGDEVTLAGDFEIDYTGGNVAVEFLTDGTETKKITFVSDGETVSEALVAVGTVPTAPTLTKTGYTLSWDKEIVAVTEAVTYTAVWTANTYTITYYVDGTEYKTVTYAYGAEVTMESAPEKDGYTFSGWDKTITTMPAENVTVNGTFTKDEEPEITGAIYKTYGVYDVEAGTYTVELKLYGVKANAGSFGFVLPGLVSVTPAEGITLFAETGSTVSPIFAKDDNHYANTWAIEGGNGNIDATVEEVLIATFVLNATSSFPEKFVEYVVDNADEKYHDGDNYLVTPHIDNSLETGNKAPVIYAEHFDRVEEPDFDGVKFTTKGTYDPTKNQYSIEIYVEGKKINLGAFGLAFDSAYMTFNPEAEESVKLADGIANYLDIVLNNTAEGYAFAFDGSSKAEGYIDATNGAVLIATITVGMTADQRTAFENAGKTMNIFVPDASVDGIEKYFDFAERAYIASLYTNDLDIPKVATLYASHTDEALELTAVDLTVNVVFNDRAEDAAGYNNAVIKLNDEKFDLEGTQHVFEGLEVGATYTVTIEKNGYLKASYEITLEESTELEFKLYAGDIKGNAADICGDGKVDLSDFVRVIRAFDSSSNEQFKKDVDLDESGLVNVSDLSIIKKNYNMTSDYNVITKK